VARSVATAPGRDVTDNARLLAVRGDGDGRSPLTAVFDAKYTYTFWRPVTAIRNGDLDGNDATVAEPGWTPFIDHAHAPEYPCAHCIVSSALGAVLVAEIGAGPAPKLSSTSSTAGGAVRTWTSVSDFTQEVALARILDGVHYRNSDRSRRGDGKKIGELAYRNCPRRRADGGAWTNLRPNPLHVESRLLRDRHGRYPTSPAIPQACGGTTRRAGSYTLLQSFHR